MCAVGDDEIDYWGWVGQAVGMMIATVFDDQDEVSAQSHVAFADDVRILFFRNCCIRIAADMQDRYVRGGDRRKDIDRVSFEVQHLLLIGKVIDRDR